MSEYCIDFNVFFSVELESGDKPRSELKQDIYEEVIKILEEMEKDDLVHLILNSNFSCYNENGDI